ncbi:hypothetical protein B0H13DRAFT_2665125, partial [Mycena leptocephala]
MCMSLAFAHPSASCVSVSISRAETPAITDSNAPTFLLLGHHTPARRIPSAIVILPGNSRVLRRTTPPYPQLPTSFPGLLRGSRSRPCSRASPHPFVFVRGRVWTPPPACAWPSSRTGPASHGHLRHGAGQKPVSRRCMLPSVCITRSARPPHTHTRLCSPQIRRTPALMRTAYSSLRSAHSH